MLLSASSDTDCAVNIDLTSHMSSAQWGRASPDPVPGPVPLRAAESLSLFGAGPVRARRPLLRHRSLYRLQSQPLLLLLLLLHQHPLEVQTSELLPFAAPTGKSCTVHLWQEVITLTPLAPLLLVRSGFSRMASISSLFRSHRRGTTPATPVSNSPFAGGNPCKTWLQLSYVPHLLYSSYNLNLILCLLNRGDVCCAGNAHRK